jgi:hypothetical protein
LLFCPRFQRAGAFKFLTRLLTNTRMTPEQIQEILALRVQNFTPKEIARKLGLRPTEVTDIIRSEGEQSAQDRFDRGEMAPIYECLVSASFPDDRFLASGEQRPEPLASIDDGIDDGTDEDAGMTIVVVARKGRPGKLMVCTYLVDYYCIGIKNVIGPKQILESEYPKFKEKCFQAFNDGSKVITIEQTQAIVLSALAYADSLELSPHLDFTETAKSHLGRWDEKLSIWCGHSDGKPLFIPTRNDFAAKTIAILDRSVGEGNYTYKSPPRIK